MKFEEHAHDNDENTWSDVANEEYDLLGHVKLLSQGVNLEIRPNKGDLVLTS